MCNNNDRSKRTNVNTLEIGNSAHLAYVPGASWNNSHTSCDILLFQYQQDDEATYAHTKFVAIVGFRLLFWFDSILFSSCYGPYEKLTQDAFMLMLLVKVVNSWESGREDKRTNGRLNKRHSGNKIQMKYFYIAHRLIARRCVCLLLLELVMVFMIYFPIQWSHILSTLFIV